MGTSHLVCEFSLVSSEELFPSNPIFRRILQTLYCESFPAFVVTAQSINYYTIIIPLNYCYDKLQYLHRISHEELFLQRLCAAPSIECHSTPSYCSASEPAHKFIIGSTAVSSTFGPDIGWGCGSIVQFSRVFLRFHKSRSGQIVRLPSQSKPLKFVAQ